jgi:hypothetical protein
MAYMEQLQKVLEAGEYKTSEYKVKRRFCTGKDRIIHVLPYYPDRIVHHCVMNVVEPIWQKGLIRDTYAAIKGRGVHDGFGRIRGFLKDRPGSRYCLKLDVKQFYPSIDHEILKGIVRRKIKCRSTLGLLDNVIDSAPGVPIGNYLSQYLGNLYLDAFDHWVKEVLGVKYYARYCDDLVLLDSDKARLHELFAQIREYLQDNLKLRVKENWQVFPVAVRGIDFLGYRFFPDYTLIRKRIVKNFKQALAEVRNRPAQTSLNRVMSYYGWFKPADARRLWAAHVDGPVREGVAMLCRKNNQRNPLSGRI